MAGEIKNGVLTDADSVMNAYGAAWGTTAQNRFAHMYNGIPSNLSGDGTFTDNKEFYDIFTSDSADVSTGFYHDETNDYYYMGLTDEASSDTTHDPDSFSNPENAFDDDDTTYASKSWTDQSSGTWYLGKTFSSKDVEMIRIKGFLSDNQYYTYNQYMQVQWYNGSVWADVSGALLDDMANNTIIDGIFYINLTGIQGLRVKCFHRSNSGNSDGNFRIYSIEYGDGVTSASLIKKETVTDTVTNAILLFNTDIDATSSQQISVSADGGSNYTDVENLEIARPTPGTELWWKIELTRTDLTAIDKITETGIKFNWY